MGMCGCNTNGQMDNTAISLAELTRMVNTVRFGEQLNKTTNPLS